MRIQCTSCGKQYRVDENRLTPEGIRVKCRSCGSVLLIRRKAAVSVPSEQGEHLAQPTVVPDMPSMEPEVFAGPSTPPQAGSEPDLALGAEFGLDQEPKEETAQSAEFPPEPTVEAELGLGFEAEPDVAEEPQAETERVAEPTEDPVAAAEFDLGFESQPEMEPGVEPDFVSFPEPTEEPVADQEQDVELERQLEPGAEPQPEPQAEYESPVTEPEPAAEAAPDTVIDRETEAEPAEASEPTQEAAPWPTVPVPELVEATEPAPAAPNYRFCILCGTALQESIPEGERPTCPSCKAEDRARLGQEVSQISSPRKFLMYTLIIVIVLFAAFLGYRLATGHHSLFTISADIEHKSPARENPSPVVDVKEF